MQPLNLNDVTKYIQDNIGPFHQRRTASLRELKLTDVLKKKNPYLFRAKNVQTAEELVKALLDAHLSSQEEGIFGSFLEGLAIYVCKKVYGGRKSSSPGIDLEFEKEGVIYIVTVKSGPNWGNSGQLSDMINKFKQAKKILRTNTPLSKNIVAVNGCCYGKTNRLTKNDYYKICGQAFWELISNNDRIYLEIIKPLNHEARKRSEEFQEEYVRVLSDFVIAFQKDFCDGIIINWEKLVTYNSGKPEPKIKRGLQRKLD
ncbi:MAG: cytosolic protein [Anaerolineales bacterium]|nr:cytosolic protein [Anaerolineales bacterium]